MPSEPIFVLPGDSIDPSLIPSHPKKALRLGPGIRHAPPDAVLPTVAGHLIAEHNKNAIRVETASGRYVPRVGELVIGVVHHSAGDAFHVHLSDYTSPAILPHMAFEAASKKTRPVLPAGSLVYARVALADRHVDPELECVSAATGKADGLGPLGTSSSSSGGGAGAGAGAMSGMLFPVSLGMARRLMMSRTAQDGKVVVLDELADAGLQFETATGRNGRVWVNSEQAKTVIAVGRAIQRTDEGNLGVEEQKKLARRLIKEMS